MQSLRSKIQGPRSSAGLSPGEKALFHIYKAAAALSDPDYRQILLASSGCSSAADPEFTHAAADRALATLETRLFERVDAGLVPDPIAQGHRWIRARFHFRHRLPRAGRINSRHLHLIQQLWEQLCQYLPAHQRSTAYFAGIVARATGRRDLGVSALSWHDAQNVIDALRDRLSYAVRRPQHDPSDRSNPSESQPPPRST